MTDGNTRPRPPADLLGPDGATTREPVCPAPELEAWARATFINEDAPLVNEEHAHLREAVLGFLWCAEGNARHGAPVVGQAEECRFLGSRWARARFFQQIDGWFPTRPHFLITIHAEYADQCSDASFMALVEHELLHCGQEKDGYGAPKFTRDGDPKFAMRAHDVEEFVSVVARYGVGAAAGRTAELVAAAGRPALICDADIAGACGTCGRPI